MALRPRKEKAAEAARNLGIHANLLRNWKQRFVSENEDAKTDLHDTPGSEAMSRRAPVGRGPTLELPG